MQSSDEARDASCLVDWTCEFARPTRTSKFVPEEARMKNKTVTRCHEKLRQLLSMLIQCNGRPLALARILLARLIRYRRSPSLRVRLCII